MKELLKKAFEAGKDRQYSIEWHLGRRKHKEHESEVLALHNVVGRSEQLKADLYAFRDMWCQNIDIATIDEYVDGLGF